MTPSDTPTPTGLAAIDALLQPFNRSNAPGLIVGIVREGHAIYRRGIGLACIEQGVAMSPRTRVRIASTSKHFTSLALLLLAEEGRLGVDDLIYQYLPELPRLHPAGPTLRQLMQHTGGWRTDMAALLQGLALEPVADWTLPISAAGGELNFEPGSRMIYSNTGYQLLARVIERISGQVFGDFLRERIFEPLGMRDTESLTSDFEVRPGMALQYQVLPPSVGGGGLRRGMYPGELRGSGSLVSTVDDMLRWLAHMRSPSKIVGSPDSWAQMLELPTLSTGTTLPYALGLFRHDYRGVEVIHHSGAVLGATSQMITVPSHGLDIMIMVNGAAVSPVALGFQIIDALLGDALLGPPIEPVPTAAHAALPGQRYHSAETGALLSFEDLAGKLGLAWIGGRAAPLRRAGDQALLACEDTALNPVLIDLEQLRGDTAPDTITISDGGHLLRCERLPTVAVGIPADELTGLYRVPDLGTDVRVQVEGDSITMRLQGAYGRNAYRLRPLSADVMLADPLDPLFAALGGYGVVNIDRAAGRVSGLRLDAPRVRHLRFIKEQAAA
ncbi:serine hydrolase domain-containing protein [Paucibacter sp. R3-3]|uniref:Serine hydrolase domain-containing protein n=1 Tax=Roseateles agri TaxID=3098619 RepID=A0ABU5DDP2_9BURK|nr:serine hydrolase domain-containing protein [Paucibacter sp. R3-3]MDY0743369.1 serine hydrolase domain-containing protein [Paucibacter sp. R3-3]